TGLRWLPRRHPLVCRPKGTQNHPPIVWTARATLQPFFPDAGGWTVDIPLPCQIHSAACGRKNGKRLSFLRRYSRPCPRHTALLCMIRRKNRLERETSSWHGWLVFLLIGV